MGELRGRAPPGRSELRRLLVPAFGGGLAFKSALPSSVRALHPRAHTLSRIAEAKLATRVTRGEERQHWERRLRAMAAGSAVRLQSSHFAGRQSNESMLPPGTRYKILVGRAPPFVFIDPDTSLGIERYSGYSIDLVELIAKRLGFEYDIEGEAGVGSSAIIAAVQNGTNGYNMATSAFTITSSRLAVVRFTQPFFDLGLRIVHEPKPLEPSVFRIFIPFEGAVWGCIAGCFALIALCLAFFEASYNDSEFRSNSINNLFLSMYYTFQTVVQQVSMQAETTEGRLTLMGAMAFFFIIAATYTAELASFLTLSKVFQIITDVDHNGEINQIDLAEYVHVIAILAGSSIESWLLNEVMDPGQPRSYRVCYSSVECLTMVKNGSVAGTVLDGPFAEYLLASNSDFDGLELLGSPMNLQGYGVILREADPNLNLFDQAVLSLRESGALEELRQKWFPALLVSTNEDDQLQAVTLDEISGIFIILGLFLAAAWIYWIIRYLLIRSGRLIDHRNEPNLSKPPYGRVEDQTDMLRKLLADGSLPERTIRNRLLMKSALETSIRADSSRLESTASANARSTVLHGIGSDQHSVNSDDPNAPTGLGFSSQFASVPTKAMGTSNSCRMM
uniref:Ionotropic glutamate receptor C-terminal domain-containing protein n=1 Tax=Erythrolobus australicus TaxID=1077150 RepID=A0A7S1TK83_9RHOD